MATSSASEPRYLSSEALKALAHPLRVQLFNALSSFGPATASGLAERLGESSGATSYHLRQLQRHGFVREDASRGNARDRWWERTPGLIEIRDEGPEDSPGRRSATELLESEFVHLEDRLFAQYRRAARDLPGDWRRGAVTSTANLQLSVEELRALERDLEAVVARYRGRDGDDDDRRRVQLQIRAFPVVDADRPAPGASPSDDGETDPSSPGITEEFTEEGGER